MKTNYKYIHFSQLKTPPGKKTSAWACHSSGPFPLGYVKWYGPWRQYCFYVDGHPVFSGGCLADIQDFLSQANKQHREQLRKVSPPPEGTKEVGS